MTDTRDVINERRQFTAILCDVMRLAAQSGEWDTHAKYMTMRRELGEELHNAIGAALDDGALTRQEAARALSPITSLETACVF